MEENTTEAATELGDELKDIITILKGLDTPEDVIRFAVLVKVGVNPDHLPYPIRPTEPGTI